MEIKNRVGLYHFWIHNGSMLSILLNNQSSEIGLRGHHLAKWIKMLIKKHRGDWFGAETMVLILFLLARR